MESAMVDAESSGSVCCDLLLERAKCGVGAGRLAGDHFRRLLGPSHFAQFAEALPNAINAVSASSGNKDAVGYRAVQLLVDLKGDGFEALNPKRIGVTGARAKDATRK